ncbi:hypothetical protein F2981_14310 [Sinorhizobium meliloti]|nr:hypothetical protein [Sinorhizobium meliloti]
MFRVKGSRPYEELVDFMSVETAEAARPLGMMVATGYSADIRSSSAAGGTRLTRQGPFLPLG